MAGNIQGLHTLAATSSHYVFSVACPRQQIPFQLCLLHWCRLCLCVCVCPSLNISTLPCPPFSMERGGRTHSERGARQVKHRKRVCSAAATAARRAYTRSPLPPCTHDRFAFSVSTSSPSLCFSTSLLPPSFTHTHTVYVRVCV